MSIELYIKDGFYDSSIFKYYPDSDAILGFGLYSLDSDILRWFIEEGISAKFKVVDLIDNDCHTVIELNNLSCDIFSRANYDIWLLFEKQEDYNLFKLTWG